MAIRIVRLGSKRFPGEGTRIGTVRRPPRGVPKQRFAQDDWYDVWYPDLAPSVELMKLGQAARTDAQWNAFAKGYRREMAAPERARAIELLAALSKTSDFSVGCYCEREERCHRSLLCELFVAAGAQLAAS